MSTLRNVEAIITTPRKAHIVAEGSKHTYSNGLSVVTVCGKFLVDLPETPNYYAHRGGGQFVDGAVTCKNCLRTIQPSKVLFADEATAVLAPGQAVLPAEAAVVPASPTLTLYMEAGSWVLHVEFSDPDSDPALVINGLDAQYIVEA